MTIPQKTLSPAKQDLLRALIKNKEKEDTSASAGVPSNLVQFKAGAPGGRTLFFFPATDGSTFS